MMGYVIAGLFAAGWLLTLVVLHSVTKRTRMLYGECVTLNERWKAASTYVAMQAVRDALMREQKWTAEDEAHLHDVSQALEALGVSLRALGLPEQPLKRADCSTSSTLH